MLTRPTALRAAACLAVALALALALMGRSGQQVVAATPVYADGAGSCAGLTPCFTTIQAAVNNAGPAPAELFVFPGTYAESVDLSDMGSAIAGSEGDITLRAVDGSGNPAAGTATIDPPSGDAIETDGFFAGDFTIDGFNVTSPDNRGMDIEATGNITVRNVTANDADNDGIGLEADGALVITDTTASGNGDHGLTIGALGDITVTNTTTNNNAGHGMELFASGDVTIDRVTSINNDDSVHIESLESGELDVDNVAITNSVLGPTEDGAIDFDDPFFEPDGTYLATSNIICGTNDGIELDPDIFMDGTGNWWGSATGPTHPDNPGGTGDPVRDGAAGFDGVVDYDPWIDAISGSGDAAVVGQPTTVSFEFTGGAGLVALMEGPGDPNGAPTFAAGTDNGSVSTSGFVSGGVLQVTLTPSSVGTATVTVTGPCGLDDTLGGNSVVLNVTAAPVPTPTTAPGVTPGVTPTVTPISLPVVGAEGGTTGTGSVWLLVALGLGGAAVAGGLTLRRARR